MRNAGGEGYAAKRDEQIERRGRINVTKREGDTGK
jgi:hypothetical protein